jgi:hypothetical protein
MNTNESHTSALTEIESMKAAHCHGRFSCGFHEDSEWIQRVLIVSSSQWVRERSPRGVSQCSKSTDCSISVCGEREHESYYHPRTVPRGEADPAGRTQAFSDIEAREDCHSSSGFRHS